MADRNSVLSPLDVPDKQLDTKDKKLYQSIVGALLYAANGTRPDIAYMIASLSRFVSTPLQAHLAAAKRVLRYLKTTKEVVFLYPYSNGISGLRCKDESSNPITGFADANSGTNAHDKHSFGGYCFYLKKSFISCKSKRQSLIATSTTESEIMAFSEAAKEATWLKRLLEEIDNRTDV